MAKPVQSFGDPGPRPALEWVPLDKITVDRNYQRDIKPARIKQICRDFSWSRFTPVQLAEQPDGAYNVFDGQHRVEAARAHPKIDAVPALIVKLDGMRAEAGAFLDVNINRSAVSTIERYWAGLEAGDPAMLAIKAVLEEAGCEVIQAQGVKPRANRTQAVTAIGRAIKLHGAGAVRNACRLLSTVWPDDPHALAGLLIQAVSRVYRANPSLREERLRDVLAASGRSGLMSDAEAIRKISGGDAPVAVARTICELYNRGLSRHQISVGGRT